MPNNISSDLRRLLVDLRELPFKQAVALAVVSILVSAIAYQARLPWRINLGLDNGLDIAGFHAPESDGATAFRWTTGAAQVTFSDPGIATPLLLTIRAQAWRNLDQVYSTDVTVNGVPVGTINKAGWREWNFLIQDPALLQADQLVVSFDSTPFVRSELYSDSLDHRSLGVAVDSVQIQPESISSADFSNWQELLTLPSLRRLFIAALLVLALVPISSMLGAGSSSRLLLALSLIVINAVQIAVARASFFPAALLCLLALGVFTALDRPLLSRAVQSIRTSAVGNWGWARVYGITLSTQPPLPLPLVRLLAFALIALVLAWYVGLGIYTELALLANNPIPQSLLGDFKIYVHALERALQGFDPYDIRDIGVAFLYPAPALFFVAPFAAIPTDLGRAAAFLVVDLLLLCLMLWGIGRRYGYSLRAIWWWFPLALGFAPFLELLHTGQINLISEFGIFLMFMFGGTLPILAGAGLSVAALTKIAPIVLLAYLAAARSRRAISWTVVFLVGALLASGLVFGWSTLTIYPDVVAGFSRTLVEGTNSQALVSIITSFGWISRSGWQDAQLGFVIYLATASLVSGVCAFLSRQREPFFLVLSLGSLVVPNIMWYHHYVFILLPVFVWIAWSRFNPWVALWCFTGLVLIQIDRWYWTQGLLPHLFVQASILSILAWQVFTLLRSDDRLHIAPVRFHPAGFDPIDGEPAA